MTFFIRSLFTYLLMLLLLLSIQLLMLLVLLLLHPLVEMLSERSSISFKGSRTIRAQPLLYTHTYIHAYSCVCMYNAAIIIWLSASLMHVRKCLTPLSEHSKLDFTKSTLRNKPPQITAGMKNSVL